VGVWQLRIEDERITTEQKFEKKMEIITRELSRREYVLNQVPPLPLVVYFIDRTRPSASRRAGFRAPHVGG
jgi:hypothetical protein